MSMRTIWDQVITTKFMKRLQKLYWVNLSILNPTKHIWVMTGVTSRGGKDIDIDEIVVDVPPVIIEIQTNYYLN